MKKKIIFVMGQVKENANGTLFVETEEGRITLGKTNGYKVGDEIIGDVAVEPEMKTFTTVAKPATATSPAVPSVEIKAWQFSTIITAEMQAKKAEIDARMAKAKLGLAITNRQVKEVDTMSTEQLWAHAV